MKTSIWFSWIILIVAISALCLAWLRCEPIGANWAGILVTAIGSIAGVVIGWQVFNAIENVKTLKQLDRLQGKLETQQQEMEARSNMLTNRIEAMDMLGFLRNADNTLNDRYFNGVRAVDLFLDSGIPDNYIYLNETLTELGNLLTIIEQRNPNLEAGVLADTENALERMLRSITRKIDETSEYLSRVQERITVLSRRRRMVCDLAREARLNIATNLNGN